MRPRGGVLELVVKQQPGRESTERCATGGYLAVVLVRADLLFVCGQALDDGHVFAPEAQSAVALCLRPARAKSPTSVLVVSYVLGAWCPWCWATFASRESACRHMFWAYQTVLISGSAFPADVIWCSS